MRAAGADREGAGGRADLRAPAYGPRRRLLVIAAGVLIVGGAVAAWLAWGGKPQSPGGTVGTTEPPGPAGTRSLTANAPGVTAREITLGMSGPFSGPAKELGHGMQIGIETYLKHVNETAGGIHGRKLKLLALDDGYEPEHRAVTMKDMLDQRPVFAFLGNVGTSTAEVARSFALEHKRKFSAPSRVPGSSAATPRIATSSITAQIRRGDGGHRPVSVDGPEHQARRNRGFRPAGRLRRFGLQRGGQGLP